MKFKLSSKFKPAGDQPQAIQKLTEGILTGRKYQTLLGVTGSGKTFTMAAVIEKIQRPVLVISPNKTLAAQLWQEFKEFFPANAVHYFVSYYDYYQPESYIPQTDTYIAKDAKINEEIDRLRYGATQALMTRNDVIIVASVSCIYGIGDPAEYEKVALDIKIGQPLRPAELAKSLVLLQYRRNDIAPQAGEFRLRGDYLEIHPPAGDETIKIEFSKNRIAEISGNAKIYPAKHFVTPRQILSLAMTNIKKELKERTAELKKENKLLEAERLTSRTNYDLEMLRQTGYTPGIENYSRHLSFRQPGEPPFTLIDYYRHRFGNDFLIFIDESHIAVPQLQGMYHGDRSRKKTLVEYGWRLPSAIDNRPLTLKEFESKVPQTVYVSATPSDYEMEKIQNSKFKIRNNFKNSKSQAKNPLLVEQLIRPTGLLDPKVEIRPAKNQIKDLVSEIKKCMKNGQRVLVFTLTKRLAEELADFLSDEGIKSHHLHSEVKTMERPSRLQDLRAGKVDVVVGVNLLREGLDLPEVALVAILDADKEGFLRNETTLIQTMGRASRNQNGRAILYADIMTGSMKKAIEETRRRRRVQEKFNREHGITPKGIQKEIRSVFNFDGNDADIKQNIAENFRENPSDIRGNPTIIKELRREMEEASRNLEFEKAARLRDLIKKLRNTCQKP
jgi:excinuclease ABC subunit B